MCQLIFDVGQQIVCDTTNFFYIVRRMEVSKMELCVPVLRRTVRIDEELASPIDHAYWDSWDQLWRLRNSGVPVVS